MPRGALTEIFGCASSGRTSFVLTALAEATRRQEVCALVDAGDSLHPESAAAAGLDLQRLLWIRCGENLPPRQRDSEAIEKLKNEECRIKKPTINDKQLTSSSRINADDRGSESIHHSPFVILQSSRNSKLEPRDSTGHWPLTTNHGISNRQFSGWNARLEQVLKTTDLLLQSGGFGMMVVDLADVPPRFARRIPLVSWFRFRRAVENTPTVLLVVEQEPYAKTCASLVLRMQQSAFKKQPSAFRNQHSADKNQHSAVSTQHSASHGWEFNQERSGFRASEAKCVENVFPAHARILRGMPVEAEVVHARLQRKPAQSVTARFDIRPTWANRLWAEC
ncbi:MAG TPA: hypothetical protein VGR48_01280 [Terriglobales bacterium]|nr:hypothetical protein [Terriglobales bacterium]